MNTEKDSPITGNRGWGQGIAFIVMGLVLAALVLLPGFVAAGFSKAGVVKWSVNDWRVRPANPLLSGTATAVLKPSVLVMEVSPAMARFYLWEYTLAGGRKVLFTF